jgi:late competence protein required for DNA uptake (superfamily II DNA/RNA helicase)
MGKRKSATASCNDDDDAITKIIKTEDSAMAQSENSIELITSVTLDASLLKCTECCAKYARGGEHMPYTLLTCGHTFCHKCILHLVTPAAPSTLAQEPSAGSCGVVLCPVCRTETLNDKETNCANKNDAIIYLISSLGQFPPFTSLTSANSDIADNQNILGWEGNTTAPSINVELCANCDGGVIADAHCIQCGVNYCDSCFVQVHMPKVCVFVFKTTMEEREFS